MKNVLIHKRNRQGFTFVELLVAIILVGVTLTLVAQMVTVSVQQNLTSQRRLSNIEIANNIFEIMSALPYEDVDASVLERSDFAQVIGPKLDEWVLDLKVSEVTSPSPGKRLELSVLPLTENDALTPFVLVRWRFAEALP